MPLDPSYKDLNRAARERVHALAERLTDEERLTRVGEHWTIGIVFAPCTATSTWMKPMRR